MSDTVPGVAIAGSLEDGAWTSLPLADAPLPSDALHVNGAAHAEPAGLLVEFRTLSPDLRSVPAGTAPTDLPSSVAGSYALSPDAQPAIVAGALQAVNRSFG